MSEATPEATPETPAIPAPEAAAPETPQATPEQDESTLPQWARDRLTKANREAAGYRTQVRELEPLAQKAQEAEEAQKTEQQRLTEQLSRAQQDAASAQAETVRYRVAATHGIGADDFDLLGSGTEEEIEARAVKIAAKNAAALAAGKAPGSERPVEQLRPGATPGEPQSDDDVVYTSLFGS